MRFAPRIGIRLSLTTVLVVTTAGGGCQSLASRQSTGEGGPSRDSRVIASTGPVQSNAGVGTNALQERTWGQPVTKWQAAEVRTRSGVPTEQDTRGAGMQ